jgi:hypothetical protein
VLYRVILLKIQQYRDKETADIFSLFNDTVSNSDGINSRTEYNSVIKIYGREG